MPTQEELRRIFDYNPDSGALVFKTKRGKMNSGKQAGSIVGNGYMIVGLGGRNYQLVHRVIWSLVYGEIPPDMVIDHLNGDRADNRISNLRVVSRADNLRNQKLRKDNKSGFPGIHFIKNKNKWVVKVNVGTYSSLEEAVARRKEVDALLGFHPNHGRVVQ